MSLKGKIRQLQHRVKLMSRGMHNGVSAPCGKLSPEDTIKTCCTASFTDSAICWHCADRIGLRPDWEGLDKQWQKNQRSKRKRLADIKAAETAGRTSWHSDQEQEDGNGRRRKNRGPSAGRSGRAGSKGVRPPRRRPSRR